MNNEHTHKAEVHMIDGDVFISLPNDGYIKLTPEQARRIGAQLFLKAARAEGKPAPEVIVLSSSL